MNEKIGYEFEDDRAEYHYIVTEGENIIHPKDIIKGLEKLSLIDKVLESRNERIKELETALKIMVNAYRGQVQRDGRYDVALSYALEALGNERGE